MKQITFILLLSLVFTGFAKGPKINYVEIQTTKGNMVAMLYNETPLHRDNFLKLVKEHYYDSLLFHRVIKDFMIQGGDPQSRNPKPGMQYGSGGPGYTVPAEFNDSLFHKKGALSAARLGDQANPKKESSGSQFYIVQGKAFTDSELQQITARTGKTIPESHKSVYKTNGGTPHLDGAYTVFGELVQGFDVLDAIAVTPTLPGDRPKEDVFIITMKLLKKYKPQK